jgi:hypothetical protein
VVGQAWITGKDRATGINHRVVLEERARKRPPPSPSLANPAPASCRMIAFAVLFWVVLLLLFVRLLR